MQEILGTGNTLLYASTAILLICMLIGGIKGFLRFTLPVISLVLAIVLTSFAIEPVFSFIKDYTPVYASVKERSRDRLVDAFIERTQGSEGVEEAMTPEQIALIGDVPIPISEQVAIIDNAPIPQILKNKLLENNNSQIYEMLGVSSFLDYVASYLANLVTKGVTFVTCVILFAVLIRLIAFALHIAEKLPIIHGINTVAGVATGAAIGILLIWIGLVVITLFMSRPVGGELYAQIDENVIMRFLYEKNIFLPWVTRL